MIGSPLISINQNAYIITLTLYQEENRSEITKEKGN